MQPDDYGRLAYLILLGIAVAGWFITENRQSIGRTLRMAFAWGFIFVAVIAVWGLWDDIRNDVAPRQAVFTGEARVEVPRAFDGHYYLTLDLDGTPVDFVVDTGASEIVLTREDAGRVGIDMSRLRFVGVANTANGQVATARARIGSVALGPITDRDVAVSVNGAYMEGSLLGMSYLQRFSRLEIADGKLILER